MRNCKKNIKKARKKIFGEETGGTEDGEKKTGKQKRGKVRRVGGTRMKERSTTNEKSGGRTGPRKEKREGKYEDKQGVLEGVQWHRKRGRGRLEKNQFGKNAHGKSVSVR